MDSMAVLQAIEANPARITWRVSGELGISQSIVVQYKDPELINCASHYQIAQSARAVEYTDCFSAEG